MIISLERFAWFFDDFSCFSELVAPVPEVNSDSNIGRIDNEMINELVSLSKNSSSRSTKYRKWTDKERYDIGKYAAENGNSNALRKFQTDFPDLKESTVRTFKKRYYEEVRKGKEQLEESQKIEKYRQKTGRPFLLGDLDAMVQSHLRSLSKKGSVINTTVAHAVARALITKYPHIAGNVDVESSRWAKSLFARMNYVRRRKTSSKVDIPENARKEIEFLFLHEIVSKVEKHNIPPELIINIDQTPLKYVPVGNTTLAPRGETSVTVEGSADKRMITGTFAITLHRDFLPIQLIYGGKTNQSLPRFKFPKDFSLSVNPKHFSNTAESLKFLKEIIIPYAEKTRKSLKCPADQKVLVIMDVFTGQMTTEVINAYDKANILIVNVPANMTKYYQPLDLTVNGYAKGFLKKRFTEWYSTQFLTYLDNGTSIDDIQIGLQLSKMKPIHAGWIVEFYNFMTTAEGKEIIDSGWRAAGISDAVRLGLSELPPIDPFNDIDPIMEGEPENGNQHLLPITDISPEEFELLCGIRANYIADDESSDEDSEWEENL